MAQDGERVEVATAEELPVVDVSCFADAGDGAAGSGAKKAAAAALRRACEHTGFFYVTGAGITPDAGPLFEAMHALFALPDGTKRALAASLSPLRRGWTGVGGAHNCVPAEACEAGPDVKESFLLGAEGDASPMHGANTWPSPDDLPGWAGVVRGHCAGMLRLSRAVSRGLALSLGLHEEFFVERMADPVAQLLLLKYPPPPAGAGGAAAQAAAQRAPAGRHVGCGAHTDCGFLTILAQDDVPGLQVRLGDKWVVAPPIAGAYLVNLGDLAAVWSGGRYRSTLHRVTNASDRPRYSAPYFCNCDFSARVEPAAVSAAAGGGGGAAVGGDGAQEPGAPAVSAGQFIMAKLGIMFDDPSAAA
ncbi:iron/ascorbate oxidoreductase [Scenedesmus sp. PABB004]|nr:iron/ascorbate oxidoreductase [Scenedesmus sp. PABB004]